MRGFKPFNQEELFTNLDNLKIEKVGEQVVTKYYNTVRSVANVSKIYEIFDFGAYVKDKVNLILSNFNIEEYKFILKRGIQEVTLLSDSVEFGGYKWYKSFHILSSSDKSRRLNLNMGLYREDGQYTILSANAFSVCKKHVTGLNQVTDSLDFLNAESFNEQIESMSKLLNHRVNFSKIRSVIVDDETVEVNHKRFNALKQAIIYSKDKIKGLTEEQMKLIRTDSKSLDVIPKHLDFDLDAFAVFNCYMSIYRNEDSHVVKKETERIFKITQHAIRVEKLKQLDF